ELLGHPASVLTWGAAKAAMGYSERLARPQVYPLRMTLAAVSPDDDARVALLHATRLLGEPAPAAFDALARSLAAGLRCPLAAVHLIDADQVWRLSGVGQVRQQASRSDSLCGLALAEPTPLVIGDTTLDARSRQLPQVQSEPQVRAYAGVALVVEGRALGVLCAMDTQSRDWRPEEVALLADMGAVAAAMIEARLHAQRARLMEARMRTASLAGSDWLWETDTEGVLTWVSGGLMQHTGLDPASEIGF